MSRKNPLLDDAAPWGADVEVSKPRVSDREPIVDFGGFCFTSGGIAHSLTEAESEAIFLPTLAPPGTR